MNKKELSERDICTKFITPALGQDYILYYKPHIPLAVIEAKDNQCSVGDGMQALEYAQTLQILFVFSSNVSNIHYFGQHGLQLFVETRHSRRVPRALQGHESPYRPRHRGLSPGARKSRPRREGSRGSDLQPERLRSHARHRRPHQGRREEGFDVSCGEQDRFQKTIVFCVDTEHAARMRQALTNENSRCALSIRNT
jgi:type I site-specific restriction endonuclease